MDDNNYIEIEFPEDKEIIEKRNVQMSKNMEDYDEVKERLKETLLNIWTLSKDLIEAQELYEELTDEIYYINEKLITITTFNEFLLTPYKVQTEFVSSEHLLNQWNRLNDIFESYEVAENNHYKDIKLNLKITKMWLNTHLDGKPMLSNIDIIIQLVKIADKIESYGIKNCYYQIPNLEENPYWNEFINKRDYIRTNPQSDDVYMKRRRPTNWPFG